MIGSTPYILGWDDNHINGGGPYYLRLADMSKLEWNEHKGDMERNREGDITSMENGEVVGL